MTKYLTKGGNAPEWVLSLSRVRMIGASKAIGPVVALKRMVGEDDPEPADVEGAGPAERAPAASNRDALARCGAKCVMLQRVVDRRSGEVRERYLADVAIPYRAVIAWRRRQGLQLLVGDVAEYAPLLRWLHSRGNAEQRVQPLSAGAGDAIGSPPRQSIAPVDELQGCPAGKVDACASPPVPVPHRTQQPQATTTSPAQLTVVSHQTHRSARRA
jgi:hypothetical protein